MAFLFPEWFASKEASGKKHTSVGRIAGFLVLAFALIAFSGTQSQRQENQNFSYGSNTSILRQAVLLDPTSQNYYDKPNLRDKHLPQVMKSNNRSHRILKMGSMKKSWGKGKMGMKKKSKYSSSDCKPLPKWWNQRELMMGKKKKKKSWGWSSKTGMMMKSRKSKKKGSSPTVFCTEAPTPQPTVTDNLDFSASPSRTPSSQPSSIPSSIPTQIDLMVSTNAPSRAPSSTPTTTPTAFPSDFPSTTPSTIPSTSPSKIPSSFPSAYPSDIPSTFPSAVPSSEPTNPIVTGIVGPGDFAYMQQLTIPSTCNLANLDIEMCISMDASESNSNELTTVKTEARNIFQGVTAVTNSARFGVTAFTDYPQMPYGGEGDYPYQVLSTGMTTDVNEFEASVDSIPLGNTAGLSDQREANFDGIVGAAQGLTNTFVDEPDCGWSASDPTIERIMVVFADYDFHSPGASKPHENSLADTIDVLETQDIRIIGLEVPSAANELDALAMATSGSLQMLDVNAVNVVDAILDGLDDLSCTVEVEAVGCDPLQVSFDPPSPITNPGPTTTIITTFSTDDRASQIGQTFTCDVVYTANGQEFLSVTYSITVQ